jgi:hypothetical protein
MRPLLFMKLRVSSRSLPVILIRQVEEALIPAVNGFKPLFLYFYQNIRDVGTKCNDLIGNVFAITLKFIVLRKPGFKSYFLS